VNQQIESLCVKRWGCCPSACKPIALGFDVPLRLLRHSSLDVMHQLTSSASAVRWCASPTRARTLCTWIACLIMVALHLHCCAGCCLNRLHSNPIPTLLTSPFDMLLLLVLSSPFLSPRFCYLPSRFTDRPLVCEKAPVGRVGLGSLCWQWGCSGRQR